MYKDGIEVERLNRYENKKSVSHVESCFSECLPTVAVSEYVRAYTNQIRQWVNGDYVTLGTDGFGRSDTREELRNYFEISKDHIVINALIVSGNKDKAEKYIKDKKIDLNTKAPWLR